VDDPAAVTAIGARLASENRGALERALSSVGQLMASEVVTLQSEQTVQEAAQLFAVRRFRHLLVTEGSRLVGVVSDRDVFRFLAGHPDGQGMPVSAVMTRNPITLGRDASVASAMSVILHKRIDCVPVVTDDLTLEGIVTTTDLLRALYALQTWLERRSAAAR
jgi:CBS domain-containing protein